MKKILVLLMALVFILGFAVTARADFGTVVVSSVVENGGDMEIIKFTIIANSTGVVTSTSTTDETCQSRVCYPYSRTGYIWKVVTDPGGTAPTAAYDVTITDDTTGADLLGGEGADRSATVTEEVVPKIGNAYGGNIAPTSFTVNVSNNSVNAATIAVYIYVVY